MKAYTVSLLIVDHDALGRDEIKTVLENTRYPNHCILPQVFKVQEMDIGEWTDDHPLNFSQTDIKKWLEQNGPNQSPRIAEPLPSIGG